MEKVKSFFIKIGQWFKKTFSKFWKWAMANKVVAGLIAGATVVALTLAIVLPVTLSRSKDNSGGEDSTPGAIVDKKFVLSLDKAPTVKTATKVNEAGVLEVKGTLNSEEKSVDYTLRAYSNETYYTSVVNPADCEHDSGKTYSAKDDSYINDLKNVFSITAEEASTYYSSYIKSSIASVFVDNGLHDKLGHDYPLVPNISQAATKTAPGYAKFVCSHDSKHVIEMTFPIISSSDYDSYVDEGSCVEQKKDCYKIKESLIDDFLEDKENVLYDNPTDRDQLIENIKDASFISYGKGTYNYDNHVGDVKFNTYGKLNKYTFDDEKKYSYIDESPSEFEAYCSEPECVSPILGDSDLLYYSDGYWKTKTDGTNGLRRYFDVTYDETTYEDVPSEEYHDGLFQIGLHGGTDMVIDSSGSTPLTSLDYEMDGDYYYNYHTTRDSYCKIINLSKLSNNGKLASTLSDDCIIAYVDGKEVEIYDYASTNDWPSSPTFVVKRGIGLYIFLGTFFPGSASYKTLWGDVDICFDFS